MRLTKCYLNLFSADQLYLKRRPFKDLWPEKGMKRIMRCPKTYDPTFKRSIGNLVWQNSRAPKLLQHFFEVEIAFKNLQRLLNGSLISDQTSFLFEALTGFLEREQAYLICHRRQRQRLWKNSVIWKNIRLKAKTLDFNEKLYFLCGE